MHRPVLYQEIIHALRPHQGGKYIDCTLGAGGHARGILEASSPDGRLLGLDVDPQALELAAKNLADFRDRAVLRRASYTNLHEQAAALGWEAVDGVLLDFGVSSMQLDAPDRGFSFLSDAPLDMRFDPQGEVTAADLVNHLPEAELAAVIQEFGEERRARQVARAIIKARPLNTTAELAKVIAGATGSGRPGIHPATRTFQALRLAVNRELEAIKTVLPRAVSVLAPQGRLAAISFHSLEDRLVKHFFRQESQDCICPPRQPVCTCGHKATLRLITRHPVLPSPAEIAGNPRARSAKLRIAEKLA